MKHLLVVFLLLVVIACGENPVQPEGGEMKGVIIMMGNAPFTGVGLNNEANQNYYLDAPQDVSCWLENNQGTLVTVVYSDKIFDKDGIGHLKVKNVQITIGQKK